MRSNAFGVAQEHLSQNILARMSSAQTSTSRDWMSQAAMQTEACIRAAAVPESIIVCHDPEPNTTAAMPRVLDTLLARGFRFVTVSEILALDEPTAAA